MSISNDQYTLHHHHIALSPDLAVAPIFHKNQSVGRSREKDGLTWPHSTQHTFLASPTEWMEWMSHRKRR